MYWLQDYTDNEIEGVFYAEELQKVQKSDDVYKIEKILAEKEEDGKAKVIVKWLGYDKKFNTWIPFGTFWLTGFYIIWYTFFIRSTLFSLFLITLGYKR